MPSTARRTLLSFRERTNWTNVEHTAIAPPYIDRSNVFMDDRSREILDMYVKYVVQQRIPKSGKGCRSLQDTVLEVILRNMSSIKNLDYWPPFLVQRIWEAVNNRCTLNFHSWKILSRSLSRESDATLGMLYYRETIDHPKLALSDYAKPLTSSSFHFISCLSITVQFPVPDLVKLAKMANLGILEIVNPEERDSVQLDGSSEIGDGLIRAWSREARDNHAFSVLRILRLWNHSNVTQAAIRYIHDFPALGIFDARACGIEDGLAAVEVIEALRLGWRDIFDIKISNRVEREFLLTSRNHATSAKPPLSLQWPRAKISRVERPAEPKASSTSFQNSACNVSSPGSNGAGHYSAPEDSRDRNAGGDNEWLSLDNDLFQLVSARTADGNYWILEAWESQNSTCWALLGEARQDSDLIKAGVKDMTKAALAEGHLVSPVPAAHIRLGKRPFNGERKDEESGLRRIHGIFGGSRRGLALIRIAIPAPAQVIVNAQQGGKAEEKKPTQNSTHRVRGSKKRNLQGLLKEFDK